MQTHLLKLRVSKSNYLFKENFFFKATYGWREISPSISTDVLYMSMDLIYYYYMVLYFRTH